MGFWDKYEPSEEAVGGGAFIGSDEKEEMAASGMPFQVVDVQFEEDGKYGDEFVVHVLLPTDMDEPRKMTFKKGSNVGSRDDMLEQALDYFEDSDAEPFWLKLQKSGRAQLLEQAEAPEAKKKPAPRRKAAEK